MAWLAAARSSCSTTQATISSARAPDSKSGFERSADLARPRRTRRSEGDHELRARNARQGELRTVGCGNWCLVGHRQGVRSTACRERYSCGLVARRLALLEDVGRSLV